ncbi:MAG: hypothetical protein AAF449_01545 [Myxococcota bacterium]
MMTSQKATSRIFIAYRRSFTGRRGFTMITTTLLLAVVAMSSMVVLDIIDLDFEQFAVQRRTIASREAAEGGLMEILNDQDVMASLPTLDTPKLNISFKPTTGSVFGQTHQTKGLRDFDADIELVRQVPMLESSHSVVRALVYDVRVRARAADGGTSRVEALVYRVAASRPGMIQPRLHAR